MLTFAAICPHPPTIIPGLKNPQKTRVKKTIKAMETLGEELKKAQPETIVIVSPHGPMRYDKFTVNLENSFKGNFSDFGAENGEYSFINDTPVAKDIFARIRSKHFPIEIIRETQIDYGALIPLSYLTEGFERKPKIVPLTYTALDWEMHLKFGKEIGNVLSRTESSVAFIASGDLSHRLSDDAPAGFSPYGIKFDKTLMDLLDKNLPEKICNLNPDFCEEAGECGLRSVLIALGAISEHRTSFQQLSYESPLGVGYLVGKWKIS